MKKRLYLFSIIFSITLCASAQETKPVSQLILNTPQPEAGKTITFTYTPQKDVKASEVETSVYFFVKNKLYAQEIKQQPSSNQVKGSFLLPDSAQSFAFKIKTGEGDNAKPDDNGGKGYVYQAYKNGKALPGAYASSAQFLGNTIGTFVVGLKPDNAAALALFDQEFKMYPGQKKEWYTEYLQTLAMVKSDEAKPLVDKAWKDSVTANAPEKSLQKVASLYYALKQKKISDSLNKIIVAKYPDGVAAQNTLMNSLFDQRNPDSLEMMLNETVPKLKINAGTKKMVEGNLGYLYNTIARNAAMKKDYAKFKKYASKITNKSSLGGLYNGIAWDMAQKNENLPFCDSISMLSLKLAEEQKGDLSNKPTYFTTKEWQKQQSSAYTQYADTYAYILSKEGKMKEALAYQQKVIDADNKNPEMNERYVEYLLALNKFKEVKKAAEGFIRAGKTTAKVKTYLQQAYVKEKGSEKGFDTYYAALYAEARAKMMAAVKAQMINKPAKMFTLKNMLGKTVSLASLKGKVVVVDFWATWCGPCKSSFPGMQMALNKYKDDKNVVFLFVDTWERTEQAKREKEVADFIAQNKYTFEVLLDEPNADKSIFKVVNDYGVDGIPTKFVIGKDSNIKFKAVGFSGNSEALSDELSMMIDLAKG